MNFSVFVHIRKQSDRNHGSRRRIERRWVGGSGTIDLYGKKRKITYYFFLHEMTPSFNPT